MKEIQNQEEMLQLQYYARYLYNSAESLYIFKVVNLILNCILAVTNAPALIIIIATITVLGINWLINCCINRAAEAREIFDCELFGFEQPKNTIDIKRKAYNLCCRKNKNYKVQKANNGKDNPPGVRDWYTCIKGNSRKEDILNCQIENTKWDEKIMKIYLFILLGIIMLSILVYLVINYHNTIEEMLKAGAIIIEIICEFINTVFNFKKYNDNLALRKNKIDEIDSNNINDKDLLRLQSFIYERRKIKIIPFNLIHSVISKKMHETSEMIN